MLALTPIGSSLFLGWLKRIGEFLFALFGEHVYRITHMDSYVDCGSILTTHDALHLLF